MSALDWLRRLFPDDEPGQSAYGDLVEEHKVSVGAGVMARVRFWARAIRFAIEYGLWSRVRGPRKRPGPFSSSARGTFFSWLDFKLGVRMLVRYPGLTLVGGLAMALGIAFGAGLFEFGSQWASPDLGSSDGDRWVGIIVHDTEAGDRELRTVHDFAVWRSELRSVQDLGAFRLTGRNLSTGEGPGEPVRVTEISASAFRVTRTPPLLGRFLIDEDERADASPVIVIGFSLWQERFASDPDVVGGVVRLGGTQHTVVGVMPEGYEFPYSQSLWTPLRLDPLEHPPGEGPEIYVFGRLAPDATLERAQGEIGTLGLARNATSGRIPSDLLGVRVVPYPELVYMPVPGFFHPAFIQINLFTLLLVVLLCSNVALLLFARATSRETELVVRNALGAGRSRIITQLFSEALVLGLVAAVVGLFGARYGYEWFLTVVEVAEGQQPFWFKARISPNTVFYVVGLTVLGAGIAGILPALKVTRGIAAGLRKSSAGGGGLRFGGIWTLVIVAQIAVTLQLPPFAYLAADEMVEVSGAGVAISIDRYLTARIEQERELETSAPRGGVQRQYPERTDDAGFNTRYASILDELERRLLTEPEVAAVTFTDRLPMEYHRYHQVELAGGTLEPPDDRGHRVGRTDVEIDYFDALSVPILSGRGFDSEDVVSGARVAIVDEPFVERVLGGRSPLGDLVRYVAIEDSPPLGPESPWYEIVGVVGDLGVENGYGRGGVYHPAARGRGYPASLVVRLRSDPALFAPRLREIVAEVDPILRLERLMPLSDLPKAELRLYAWGVSAVTMLTLVGLMLSLAGIYAVMSFAVTRRTREIGIRVALGANPGRLLPSVFRRPLTQVGIGLLGGVILLMWTANWLFDGLTIPQYFLAAIYATAMSAICMLACAVPTRRALRIEPVEALNVEG